jgi:hypothetical protein
MTASERIRKARLEKEIRDLIKAILDPHSRKV